MKIGGSGVRYSFRRITWDSVAIPCGKPGYSFRNPAVNHLNPYAQNISRPPVSGQRARLAAKSPRPEQPLRPPRSAFPNTNGATRDPAKPTSTPTIEATHPPAPESTVEAARPLPTPPAHDPVRSRTDQAGANRRSSLASLLPSNGSISPWNAASRCRTGMTFSANSRMFSSARWCGMLPNENSVTR